MGVGPEVKDSRRRLPMGYVLDGRWKVKKVLGEGGFGAVYEVDDLARTGQVFALKIESNDKTGKRFLPLEVTVLRALRNSKAKFYPGYEWCGQNARFNYVVMGLVGKNLNALRRTMPKHMFHLRSSIHLAERSLHSLEELHDAGFLHRDLKPGNMCVGRGPKDLRSVYILDWGMCRKYVNEKGEVHRPRTKAGFRGTPWYASVSSMGDNDQGRCDDVWSWFFTIIEVTVGRLPWDDAEKAPSDKREYMTWLTKKKDAIVFEPDVLLINCPPLYTDIWEQIYGLAYADRPDYGRINDLLNQVLAQRGIAKSKPLDWEEGADTCRLLEKVPNSNMMHGSG